MSKTTNYYVDDENQKCFKNRYQLQKAVRTLIDLHPELESEHGGFQVFWVKPNSPLYEPDLLGSCIGATTWRCGRWGAKRNVRFGIDLFGEYPRLITLAHEVAHILVDGFGHSQEFEDYWIKLSDELGVLDEKYIQFYLKKVCRPRDERERCENAECKADLAVNSDSYVGEKIARKLADVHSRFLSDAFPVPNKTCIRKYIKILTSDFDDVRFPIKYFESLDHHTAVHILIKWAANQMNRNNSKNTGGKNTHAISN
jgi:hypothetical protein